MSLGDLFGGESSADAIMQAGAMEAAAAEKAIQTQQEMYQQARSDVAPWRQAGGAAVGQIGGLLNLPGYTAVDPTATLKATPGYQWMQQQGVQALDRSAAGRGLALSGAQRKGVTDWGQNLALTKAWQPYMSTLQNLSGQGMGAAAQSGQWAMATGQNVAQTQMAGAAAQANALVQAQNARQAAQNQMFELAGWAFGAPWTAAEVMGKGGGPFSQTAGQQATAGGGPFTAANTGAAYEVPYGNAALDYSSEGIGFSGLTSMLL